MKNKLKNITFSVWTGKNERIYKEYKKICKKYNIEIYNKWSGNVDYYGVTTNNAAHCYSLSFGQKKFSCLYDFKKFLTTPSNIDNFSII